MCVNSGVFVSLLCMLCVKLTLAVWNTQDFMKREHSLLKPYGTGVTVNNWDFEGDVMITSNYIRITNDLQSQTGMLWNTHPTRVKNWEMQVHFKVHGKGKDLFGDGFVIWYAKDRMQKGPVFGNIDFFHGLAIVLDTYSNHNGPHNHQHPYISAMINNGSLHYDHDRDGTHTQLAGCEAKFRNLDHDTHIAIRYENDVLTVLTDIENKAAWKECFRVEGIQLPTGYHFGITGTTGDLSDNHDILAIRLYELELSKDAASLEDRSNIIPSAARFEPPRERVDDIKPSAPGIKMFIFMLFGCIALVACVVGGIMLYQKHQEQSRKRFY